jgi:hypothetical protein
MIQAQELEFFKELGDGGSRELDFTFLPVRPFIPARILRRQGTLGRQNIKPLQDTN